MWAFFKDYAFLLIGPALCAIGFIFCLIKGTRPDDMRRTLAWCCASVPALVAVLLLHDGAPMFLLTLLLLTAATGLGGIASIGYFIRRRRPGFPPSRPAVPILLLVASLWDVGVTILVMQPGAFGAYC